MTDLVEQEYVYCLEPRHPGVPLFDTNPVAMDRIFAVPIGQPGCPVCPRCEKEVSATPCQKGAPPQSVLELAARMAVR